MPSSREPLIGLLADPGCGLAVGVLGIFKSGAALVPLSPGQPEERLALMAADCGLEILVTQSRHRELALRLRELAPSLREVVFLEDLQSLPEPVATLAEPPSESLAYVIYTSGSTGRPKGVAVSHANAVPMMTWSREYFGLDASRRVLQSLSYAFDFGLWEIVTTLISGATLHVPSAGEHGDPQAYARLVAELGIDTLHTTPSFFRAMVETGQPLPGLRTVHLGGEALTRDQVERFAASLNDECRLYNGYGPTEATVNSTIFALGAVAALGERVPIGRPSACNAVYILEERGEPAPVGLAGELWVGGPGVARGYLGRPDLTAERFLPDRFGSEPGGRLYRTGDRVRWRPDGQIEFLGRLDDQVKVRGFRVEPGEIEAALRGYTGVREAVVAARRDPSGGTALVAWLIWEGEPRSGGELRSFLRERLPEAMVPSAFVAVPALLLTSSGKVDRRALPEPAWEASSAGQAPRTPVEELLAGIWAEVLGLERVGVEESFFELGGHSLLATRVVSRARSVLGAELSVRDLFEAPTVAALARRVTSAPVPEPIRVECPAEAPLSFAQERLWFLSEFAPGNPFYNMPSAVRLRGDLKPEALRLAFGEIARRHEVLRTTFAVAGGRPVQVVAPARGLDLPLIDLSGLPASATEAEALKLARRESLRSFDLGLDPMLRASLLRLGAGEHVLLATLHHIAADGWSVGVFSRELSALYEAFAAGLPSPLPELPIQYRDFAVWQRRWLSGEQFAGLLRFWTGKLAGAERLRMPADRARPAVSRYRGAIHSFPLPTGLAAEVRSLGRREGATPYMVLLAAFLVLLSRYSGQRDVMIGSPIANRNRSETEGLIGFFVNMLAMRCRVDGDATFRQLLARVRETSLAAYHHQDLPFERLVEELDVERDAAYMPLFQVTFALLNMPAPHLGLKDLEASPLEFGFTTNRFDLSLDVWERPEGFELRWTYSTEIFDAATLERMERHFLVLFSALAGDTNRVVAEGALFDADELRELLREWAGAPPPERIPLAQEAFERQADLTPDAVAVFGDGEPLTYAELDRQANRLARLLARRGIGREDVVGVCLERSGEMLVGLLGILKAGAAYLPLDPENPPERLAYILDDAGSRLVLTRGDLAARVEGGPAGLFRFDRDAAALEAESRERPAAAGLVGESLAYVLYTSGSTGRPKGVAVPHRALANFLHWAAWDLLARSARRLPLVTRLSFDASLLQLLAPLVSGDGVWLVDEGELREPAALLRLLEGGRESGFNCVPSLWSVLLAEIAARGAAPGFGHLYLGGEGFPPELVERTLALLPQLTIWNLYGPTEVTSNATCGQVAAGGPVTVGGPIRGMRVRLLDAGFQPMPVGAIGEICVGGPGLARGYANRPDLTAAAFVPDPWSPQPGGRLFRTGDLGRIHPHDGLEVLGRLDQQVKVRGFRIELGEIEAALRRQPGVQEAVVIAREDVPGDRQLVAYVVPEAADAAMDAGAAAEQVERWQEVFDDTYDQAAREEGPDAGFSGWNSSFTGEPIPAEEMREWVDRTVERILALEPRRALEIGSGTGLLLFRVAPVCSVYHATDFSRTALRYLRERLAEPGRELPQVSLRQAPADRLQEFAPGSFDTVILNSVAQYFPDSGYLLRVMESAVRLVRPGGTVFVGDVRSLPLLATFHLAVQLHRAPDSLTLRELRERARREEEQDEELVVDPAFFQALTARVPGVVQVEIRPKLGRFRTEMTVFRYDVVLHVGPAEAVAPSSSRDWRGDGLTAAGLRRWLEEESPARARITGVPNARLRRESEALALLREEGAGERTVGELRRDLELRLAASPEGWVAPDEVARMLAGLPYDADLSWASSDEAGAFDILLTRRGSAREAAGPDLPAAVGEPERPGRRSPTGRCTVSSSAGWCPRCVPGCGRTSPSTWCPRLSYGWTLLPLNANGKIDRRALPAPGASRSELGDGVFVAPRTPTEEALAEIWRDILGIDRVGVHDDFFDLGGHSLLATQVVSRVRERLEVELPLRVVFEAPTVAGLALAVVQRQAEEVDDAMLARLLGEIGGLSEEEQRSLIGETGSGDVL